MSNNSVIGITFIKYIFGTSYMLISNYVCIRKMNIKTGSYYKQGLYKLKWIQILLTSLDNPQFEIHYRMNHSND